MTLAVHIIELTQRKREIFVKILVENNICARKCGDRYNDVLFLYYFSGKF